MYYANVYYGGNDYRDYIAHHGVKGMKWGKHLFGLIDKGVSKLPNAFREASGYNARKSYEGHRKAEGKYRGLASGALRKWKQNPKDKIAKGNVGALNRSADYERDKARESYEKYSKSALGRIDTAIHNGRVAARNVIKSAKATGKKIGQFAKNTINAGKSLIKGALRKIREKMTIPMSKLHEVGRKAGAVGAGIRAGVSQFRRTGDVGGSVRKGSMVTKARSRYTGSKTRKGYNRVNSYAR